MGEIVYYIVDILIYTSLAVYILTKTDQVVKRFLKKETKANYTIARVIGGVVLVNAIIDLVKLLNVIMA